MTGQAGAATTARSLKRTQVRVITVFFMIYILVSGGSFGIEDMVSSSGPGLTLLLLILLPVFWALPMGFDLLGQDIGWYGIAGFAALFSGPVLYYVFRAVYGGPSTPSCEAGDEAIALAEAEAEEEG